MRTMPASQEESHMTELKHRLMRYAAVAAAIPSAAAHAGIIADDNANIVLGVGGAQAVDFGPGWGELFRFELRGTNFYFNNPPNYNYFGYTTSYGGYVTTFTSTTGGSRGGKISFNPLFQFLGGGAQGGGVMADATSADPYRLGTGDPISAGQFFFGMFPGYGTGYDIAHFVSGFFSSSSGALTTSFYNSGSWNPDARGFLGFSFLLNGNTHYGWFDVETRSNLSELVVHAWAFNDTPDAPIAAGEVPAPAAAGLLALALGAAGVRRSRRDRASLN